MDKPTVREATEEAFGTLIADELVEIGSELGELHIIADEWTLVLTGDPIQRAMLAVDEDDSDPQSTLDAVFEDEDLAALRDLDSALAGTVGAALNESPDLLTKALGRILEG